MSAGPGTFARERGFSVRELALTLLLLAVVVVIAVRLIDLRTKLLGVEKDDPGPGGILEIAERPVSRDIEGAARGGVALEEALRPVEDDTAGSGVDRYADEAGKAVFVRSGTDQFGLRGVIRSPFLSLHPPLTDPIPFADRIRNDPSSVIVRGEMPGSDKSGTELDSVLERLGAPKSRSKRFFLVADASGRYAIALLRGFSVSEAPSRALELRLDFTDPEAVSLNLRGAPDAAGSLGPPVKGGLLDDLVWFVAQGPEGRPPDYVASGDPATMRFPHPFLAVAERAGGGRWEITRVAEDVEDFQVAWGIAGAGGTLVWRGDTPSSLAPRADELRDPAGKPLLQALKLAWTAKGEHRYARADGPRPATDYKRLLNARTPGSLPGAEPVGWDPDESRRVPFDRASREIEVPIRGAGSPAGR